MTHGGHNRGKGKGIAFLRAHVDYQGKECLIWPFGRDAYGYGQFGFNGKRLKAHRWMCEQKNGHQPPDKPFAAHDCGNGHLGCIHPDHLAWKDRDENALDNIRHGVSKREPRKGRNPRKLSPEQVQEIISLKGKVTCLELSKIYGIHQRHINFIHNGGAHCKRRVFTVDEVRRIREMNALEAAREFGVARSSIYRIQHRQSYTYVP